MFLNEDFEVPKEEHAIAIFEMYFYLHRLITYLFDSRVVCRSTVILSEYLDFFEDSLTVNTHSDFTRRHLPGCKVGRSHDKRGIRIIHANLLDRYLEADLDFALSWVG